MKKYVLAIILSACMLCTVLSVTADDYPHAIWAPLGNFETAMNAGDDAAMYDWGMQVISIMEAQPDSHLKKEFLAGKYEQVSRCAERLGYYDKAVELHRAYLPYGEYMGWTDGVLYAKKKIYLLTPYLDVYIKDNAYYPEHFGAKFEPVRGVYFGSVYDDDTRLLDYDNAKIKQYFPKQNSTWLIYLEFGDKPWELGRYNRYLTEAKEHGVAVEFAWNTYSSLGDIAQYDSYIKQTVDFLDSYGIPIFLRFGAEMNIGANGDDPQAFIQGFRTVAAYAKTKQNIAMVWSPHDLGALDRPYAQYYPGNEYVDWVGASLYVGKYFEGQKDHGSQTDPLNTYFVMDEFAHPVMRMVELTDFMRENGIQKPIMLAECGVVHYSRTQNEDLTDWAKIQMRRLYNDLLLHFPQIKMVNYFNVQMENEINAYELYSNAAINDLYNQLVDNPYLLSSTNDTAAFGYRPLGGGTVSENITVNTAAYYPKTLYNSVKYWLDGNFVAEYWDTPYELSLNGLSDGAHTLRVELIDNGQIRLSKEISFTVQRQISVQIDGETVTFPDQQPVLVSDRTLVPARGVFEKMDMTVSWNGEIQQVTVTGNGKILTLTIGEDTLYKNGTPIQMDVPAQTINDRTMLPLRAVAEALDAKVDWDDSSQTVLITTN